MKKKEKQVVCSCVTSGGASANCVRCNGTGYVLKGKQTNKPKG